MSDVYIKLDKLNDVKTELGLIVEEFDKATDRADQLEDAIGDPFDRNNLREAVEDFEDRWDKKRGQLNDSLKKVLEHVTGVIDSVEDWDSETAIKLQGEE